MTTSKKSNLITLILTAITVIAVLLGAFIVAFPKKPLEAVNRFITISKVNRLIEGSVDADGKFTPEYEITENGYTYNDSATQTLKNSEYVSYEGTDHYFVPVKNYDSGDFVVLNNADLEKTETSEDTFYNTENLLINFAPTSPGFTFAISSVTLKLNGEAIYTGSNYQYGSNSLKDQEYSYLIDLHNLFKLNTNPNASSQKGEHIPYENVKGALTVTVVYNVVTNGTHTEEQTTDETTVYLINEDEYISTLSGEYSKRNDFVEYKELTTKTLLEYINSTDASWPSFAEKAEGNNIYEYKVGKDGGSYNKVLLSGAELKIEDIVSTADIFTTFKDLFKTVSYITNDKFDYYIYGYKPHTSTVYHIVDNKLYENSDYYYYNKNDKNFVKINDGDFKIQNGTLIFDKTPASADDIIEIANDTVAYIIDKVDTSNIYANYDYLKYFDATNNKFKFDIYVKDGIYFVEHDITSTFEQFTATKPQNDVFKLNATELTTDNANTGGYIYFSETDNFGKELYNYTYYNTDSISNFYIQIPSRDFIYNSTANSEKLFESNTNAANSTILLYTYDQPTGNYTVTTKKVQDLYNSWNNNDADKYYVSILDLAADESNSTHANRTYYHANFELYLRSLNNVADGLSTNSKNYFEYFLNGNEFNSSKIPNINDNSSTIYTYDQLNDKFVEFKANKVENYFVALNDKDKFFSNSDGNGLFINSTGTINNRNLENSKITIFTKDASGNYVKTNIALKELYDNPNASYYYCLLDIELRSGLKKNYYIGRNETIELPDATELEKADAVNHHKEQNRLYHSLLENSQGYYFVNKLQLGLQDMSPINKFYRSVLDTNTYYYQTKNTVLTDTEDNLLSDAFNEYNVLADVYYYNNRVLSAEPPASQTLPILANTEKTYKQGLEVNYFNFSNANTFNYFGKELSDDAKKTLQYPTYFYDVTKYNLSYTHIVNGDIIDTVTTSVEKGNAGNILVLHHNHKQKGEFTEKINLPESNIAELKFSTIGTYNFNVRFATFVNGVYNFDQNDTALDEQNKYVHNTTLYIYGYQLFYTNYANLDADGNTTFSEFKNGELSADISFGVDSTISEPVLLNYSTATLDDIVSEANELIGKYGTNLTFYYTYTENGRTEFIEIPMFKKLSSTLYYQLSPNLNEQIFELDGTAYKEIDYTKTLETNTTYYRSIFKEIDKFNSGDPNKINANELLIEVDTTVGVYKLFSSLADGDKLTTIYDDEALNPRETLYYENNNDYYKATSSKTNNQLVYVEKGDTYSVTTDLLGDITISSDLANLSAFEKSDFTTPLYKLGGTQVSTDEITAANLTNGLTTSSATQTLLNYLINNSYKKAAANTRLTSWPASVSADQTIFKVNASGKLESVTTQTIAEIFEQEYLLSGANLTKSPALNTIINSDKLATIDADYENITNLISELNLHYHNGSDYAPLTADNWDVQKEDGIFAYNGSDYTNISNNTIYVYTGKTGDNYTGVTETTFANLTAESKPINLTTKTLATALSEKELYISKIEDITSADTYLSDLWLFKEDGTNVKTFADISVYQIIGGADVTTPVNSNNLSSVTSTNSTYIVENDDYNSSIKTFYSAAGLFTTYLDGYTFFSLNADGLVTPSNDYNTILESDTFYKTATAISGGWLLEKVGGVYNFATAIISETTYCILPTTDNKETLWYTDDEETYTKGASSAFTKISKATDKLTRNRTSGEYIEEHAEGLYYIDGDNYIKFDGNNLYTGKTYCELLNNFIVLVDHNDGIFYQCTRNEVAADYNTTYKNYYTLDESKKSAVYIAGETNDAQPRLKYSYPTDDFSSGTSYYFLKSKEPITQENYYKPNSSNIINYIYKQTFTEEDGKKSLIGFVKVDPANFDEDKLDSDYYYNYIAYLCEKEDGIFEFPTEIYYTVKNNLEQVVNTTTENFDNVKDLVKTELRGVSKNYIKADDVVRTNQAPVSANFFANLAYGTGQNDDFVYLYSFYDYYENESKLNSFDTPTKTSTFTNTTTFKDNGFYVVYMLYTFADYSYHDGTTLISSAEGANKKLGVQTFAFEIRKSQPNITAYDTNNYVLIEEDANFKDLLGKNKVFEKTASGEYTLVTDDGASFVANNYYTLKTLSSGDYTKNDIEICFNEQLSNFDIEPYAKVTVADVGGNKNTNTLGHTTIYATQSIYNSLPQEVKNGCEFKETDDFKLVLGGTDVKQGDWVKYSVEIFYGANWTSSTKRIYTIDRQDIESPKAFQVVIGNNNFTLMDETLKTDLGTKFTTAYYNNAGVLKTDGFTLNWETKDSGSKITASYKFIKLEDTLNSQKLLVKYNGSTPTFFTYTDINDNGKFDEGYEINYEFTVTDLQALYLKNGKALKTLSDELPYTDSEIYLNAKTHETNKTLGYIKVNPADCLWETETYYQNVDGIYTPVDKNSYDPNNLYKSNLNSVLTQSGVYIFTLTDSAGNEKVHTVFLDNSAPAVYFGGINNKNYTELVNIEDENADPIISEDLVALWAQGKEIDVYTTLLTSLTENEQASLTAFLGTTGEGASAEVNNFVRTNVSGVNWSFEHISNTDLDKSAEFTPTSHKNGFAVYSLNEKVGADYTYEGYHNFKVLYNINKADLINSNFQQICDPEFELMLNTDNSKLMVYTVSDPENYTEHSFINLKFNKATNREGVVLQWQDTKDGKTFIIKSVKYNYFAFTFDINSANYPFSNVPTSEDIVLYELGEENENVDIYANNKVTTAVINTLSGATREGVYVVTREYLDGTVPADSKDTILRTYYFYVDRHGVVSEIDMSFENNNHPTLIGEFINILLTASENVATPKALSKILGKDILEDGFTNTKQDNNNNSAYFLTTNKLPLISYILDNKYVEKNNLTTLISYLNLATDNKNFMAYYQVSVDGDGKPVYEQIVNLTNSSAELENGFTIILDEATLQNIYLKTQNDDPSTPTENESNYVNFAFITGSVNQDGGLLYKYNDGGEKYAYITGYNYLNAFNIEYQLFRYDNNKQEFVEDKSFTKDEVTLSKAIKEAGTYKLVITDLTGYDKKVGIKNTATNLEASVLNFYFTINTDKPNAEVVKFIPDGENHTGEQLLNKSLETVTTNSKNIKLVWNENDEFMAQIDKKIITLFIVADDKHAQIVYNADEEKVVSVTNSNIDELNNVNPSLLIDLFKYNEVEDKDWDFELELFKENNIFDLSYYKANQIDVTINVTVQFEGEENYFKDENGVSFFKNVITINLDYTPPKEIYNSLKNADSYFNSLNEQQKNNFDNYNSLISFDNYSFIATPKDNTLTLTSSETRVIYYRQYDKYSNFENYNGLQSLVENDPRFKTNIESGRINFEEGTNDETGKLFNRADKQDNNFKLKVSDNNYYEIIEIDTAGNYRIYTVYTINNENEFKLDSSEDKSLTINNQNTNAELNIDTADANFKFSGINQLTKDKKFDWFDIVVTDKTANKIYNLTYSPVSEQGKTTYKDNVEYFANSDGLLDRLTEICNYSNTKTGNAYDIKIYTALGEGTIYLRFKGELLNFESLFTNEANSITVTINKLKTTTYLKELKIEKFKNNETAGTTTINFKINTVTSLLEVEYPLFEDGQKFVIIDDTSPTEILIKVMGQDSADYWFDAKDNFGEEYSIQQFIGVTNLNEFTVNGTYQHPPFEYTVENYNKDIDGSETEKEYNYKQIFVYYTGVLNYKFEPRVFRANFKATPIVLKNGSYEFDTGNNMELKYDEYTKIYQNGICSFTTTTPNQNLLIEVYNNRGYLVYQYIFVYYSIVQNVNLTTSTGTILESLMQEKAEPQLTSKFITIDFETKTQGLNSLPVYVDINGKEINSGNSIYDKSNTNDLATASYLYDSDDNFITTRNESPISNTYAEITYTNLDGITTTCLAEDGTQLKECGTYVIKIYNSVGFVYRTYKIELIETVNSYYNVISNNKVLTGFSYNSTKLTNDADDDGNYTIYYASNSNYIIEVNSDASKGITHSPVSTATNYTVYKLESSNLNYSSSLPLFFIVAVVDHSSDNYHSDYDYIMYQEFSGNDFNKLEDDDFINIKESGVVKSEIVTDKNSVILKIKATYGEDAIYSKNYINIEYYYNEQYVGKLNYATKAVNGFDYYTKTDGKYYAGYYYITLTESGNYKFKISDQTGKVSYFGNEQYLTVKLENNVLFNINGDTAINNAVYNGPVTLTLLNNEKFNTLTVDLVATLNNKPYEYDVDSTTNTYTFKDFGVYSIKLTYTNQDTKIETIFVFTILNPLEATHTYNYIAPNGYEIIKIEKLQGEFYTSVTQYYSNTSLTLTYDFDTSLQTHNGAGKYRITVKKYATTLTPDYTFIYDVWINSAEPYIKINVKDGESTRKEVKISVDINAIYKELGEVTILIDGKGGTEVKVDKALIDKYTNEDGTIRTLTVPITVSDSYIVKVYTESGNTLYVYNFTKKNSLNTGAIILIIVAIAVVGIVIFLFFKMRKKMTVR